MILPHAMQDNILEACKLGVILHAAESLFHSILHGLLLHELLLYIIYCSVMLCRVPPGILDVWVGPRIKQKLVDYISNESRTDYMLFERNTPFKFQKAAHLNLQIIGLASDFNLEERVKKLLKTFQRQQSGSQHEFREIKDRESDLRSELNNDPTKYFFYLELSGMRTARGRQKIRFYREILQGAPFDI